MLLQFTFQNFRSFRDEATLDLTAAELPEEADVERYVSVDGEKVLRAAAIYGANGGGKSNVVKAFQSMGWYVCNSHNFEDDGEHLQSRVFPRPFLFDAVSKDVKTSFEVYFLVSGEPGKTYNYGFTVGEDGVDEEWLNVKNAPEDQFCQVFYRKGKSVDLDSFTKPTRDMLEITFRKETLVVSAGAKLNIDPLKVVRDFFKSSDVLSFGLPEENWVLSRTFPRFERDEERETFFKGVAPFLQTFDPSIVATRYEIVKTEKKGTIINLFAAHKTAGSDELTFIPMTEESDGTQKMLALYRYLREVFDKGSLLFIDELNSRLHPLLQRSVLLSFLDPRQNPNGAQLVFTTHEPWLLDCHLLHRDEVWFAEKDKSGASTLYSLAEFQQDDQRPNYLENYLYGNYGAIPRLTAFRPVEPKENSDEHE
ncbi:MAG: ATP-binding protein [Thermoguttaceae bacterium]|nr:ATP-binding protein [Thermoguttaceae bacterium]